MKNWGFCLLLFSSSFYSFSLGPFLSFILHCPSLFSSHFSEILLILLVCKNQCMFWSQKFLLHECTMISAFSKIICLIIRSSLQIVKYVWFVEQLIWILSIVKVPGLPQYLGIFPLYVVVLSYWTRNANLTVSRLIRSQEILNLALIPLNWSSSFGDSIHKAKLNFFKWKRISVVIELFCVCWFIVFFSPMSHSSLHTIFYYIMNFSSL